jgi:hypothetical protein
VRARRLAATPAHWPPTGGDPGRRARPSGSPHPPPPCSPPCSPTTSTGGRPTSRPRQASPPDAGSGGSTCAA